MKTFNSILMNRRNKFYIEPDIKMRKRDMEILVFTLSYFGFKLSKELKSAFQRLSDKEYNRYSKELISILSELFDTNKNFDTLFKYFPMSTPENYSLMQFITILDNIFPSKENVHLSCGHNININLLDIEDLNGCPLCGEIVPELQTKIKRKELADKIKLKKINIADKNEIYEILSNLLESPVPLSDLDYDDIEYIIKNGNKEKVLNAIPETIKTKEILAKLYVILLKLEYPLPKNILTVTDILRIVAALQGNDISLRKIFYFKLTNSQRKFVLSLFKNANVKYLEIKKRREIWKRLGEVLHPGSYKEKYKEAYIFFDIVRNIKTIETLNSKFEKLLKIGKYEEAFNVLSEEPGILMKFTALGIKTQGLKTEIFAEAVKKATPTSLLFLKSYLIGQTKPRNIIPFYNEAPILKEKEEQVIYNDKIENNLYLQLSDKLNINESLSKGKEEKEDIELWKEGKVKDGYIFGRYFFPKDGYFLEYKYTRVLKNVDPYVKIIDRQLSEILSTKLKAYIDPKLKKILVPKNLRDISESLNFFAKGSRIKFKANKTMRLFLYWKGTGVDLDLSAVIYDKDFNELQTSAYTSLRTENTIHSGDVRTAPKGAAEFIDISEIKSIPNARYIVPSVISYTGHDFIDHEAFMGVMHREKPKSGELFEPSTVKLKFDLKGKTSYIPFIFDIKKEEFIISDIYGNVSEFSNAALINHKFIESFSIANDLKNIYPTMYDLFSYIYGESSKADADLTIGLKDCDINVTEIEKVMSFLKLPLEREGEQPNS